MWSSFISSEKDNGDDFDNSVKNTDNDKKPSSDIEDTPSFLKEK